MHDYNLDARVCRLNHSVAGFQLRRDELGLR